MSIHGRGFRLSPQDEVICKFGALIVYPRAIESHELQVIAPSHTAGPVCVEVSRNNGRTWTRDGVIFTYYTRNQVEEKLAIMSGRPMSSEISQSSSALPSSIMMDFVS